METIPEILDYAVRQHDDRPALIRHGEPDAPAYTFAEVGRLARAAAGRLADRGIRPGTAVALLAENRPAWGLAYFAIHGAGAVCVPVDARLGAEEVRRILERSRARLLLVSASLEALGREAAGPLGGVDVTTVDALLTEADRGGWPDGAGGARCQVRGADVAVLSFTSGTTGASKAIVLTHANIASNASTGAERMDVSSADRLLSILPLNHLFEQTAGLLVPLVAGASVTYPGTLNPRSIMAAMGASRTTIALVVPAVLRLFRKRIVAAAEADGRGRLVALSRRLSRAGAAVGLPVGRRLFRRVHEAFGGAMRFFISGGAPLDADVAGFFRDLSLPVLEGYGLSEAAPVVSCNTLGERATGSVGRPLPGVQVRIDAPGKGDGVGEILVRGPNVMAGYFEDPGATARVLQGGWLRTGDLGRLDADGYLYVVGRSKDLIVGESGRNVYPEEIEEAIRTCGLVREVCVVGHCPPEATAAGEEVVALVVPDDEAVEAAGANAWEGDLRSDVRAACGSLPAWKRPRYLVIWPDEFPRTTTLKVKKHEIRRRLPDVPMRPL